MDLATILSELNNPQIGWDNLRHLQPVLLDAVRNKNMTVVKEFLNHKMWGKAYCDGDLIDTMAQSQWKDGWDLVVKKSFNNDKVLRACLIAVRPSPERFNDVLNQYWKAYTDVAPKTKKMERFLLGVHQIALSAIRFNDPDLYHLCKAKSAPYINCNQHWNTSADFSTAISKYTCYWALDDMMRSSGHPHHFLEEFLKTHSVIADQKKLLALCHTLLEVSDPSSENPHKLINTLFEYILVQKPIFNELCKDIDRKSRHQPTIYSSTIFEFAYGLYFYKKMDFNDAAYWCARVWDQRISTPTNGYDILLDMLTGLLNASADAQDWNLVVDLAARFPEKYDILIHQYLKHDAEPSTVDQLLGAVNDATNQAIVKSSHNSPIVQSFREKTQLTNAIKTTQNSPTPKKM